MQQEFGPQTEKAAHQVRRAAFLQTIFPGGETARDAVGVTNSRPPKSSHHFEIDPDALVKLPNEPNDYSKAAILGEKPGSRGKTTGTVLAIPVGPGDQTAACR
jgi:hypothetical protein